MINQNLESKIIIGFGIPFVLACTFITGCLARDIQKQNNTQYTPIEVETIESPIKLPQVYEI